MRHVTRDEVVAHIARLRAMKEAENPAGVSARLAVLGLAPMDVAWVLTAVFRLRPGEALHVAKTSGTVVESRPRRVRGVREPGPTDGR